MPVAADIRQSLALQTSSGFWAHIFPQMRFSVLSDLSVTHLSIPHERLFQGGTHGDPAASQDGLSGRSCSCSWMSHSRQTHFLSQRTVHLVSVGQAHSPAAGRGRWQLVNPTGSHRGLPMCLREEAPLCLSMKYCRLPACTHHNLWEEQRCLADAFLMCASALKIVRQI